MNLSLQHKSVIISLQLNEIINSIQDRANKWFKYVYIDNNINNLDFETEKLDLDLDYLFSKFFWIVDITKDLNLDIDKNIRYLEDIYTYYKNKDFKSLVNEPLYHVEEGREYTIKELREIKVKVNELLKSFENE